jgi:hypothetical protein
MKSAQEQKYNTKSIKHIIIIVIIITVTRKLPWFGRQLGEVQCEVVIRNIYTSIAEAEEAVSLFNSHISYHQPRPARI